MQTTTEKRKALDERGVTSILETLDVETLKRTVLKEFDKTIEAPNWTKDGKALIFNETGKICRYDLASGTVTRIDADFVDQCNNDHVLSPDGTSIAVSHHTWEDGQSRIYTLPLSGGKPALITPIAPSYLHGWSPDGKTLAYCAERNGQYDVYTIPVSGGIETQLTNEPSLDDGPEYSPCGKYIWFNSTRSGLMQIWRMNADGSNPMQITKDEANNWFAHLSPNGKRAVYISYKKGDVEPNSHPPNKNVAIRMFSVDGAENSIKDLKTLAEFFGGQGSLNVNSWAPDNKTIAFVSYRKK